MAETANSNRFFLVWCVLGLACLTAFIALTLLGIYKPGGLCLAGAWFSLAVLVRFHPFLKSFSYTIVVLGCVTTSMYFPEFYLHVGGVPTMIFIIPILQVIMFGMGTQLSLRDFQGILKQPWGVLVGLICQFTIMPFVGYTLAVVFGFEPEIAAGLILIGSVPCGIASNVMNFIARSNIALSVTLTAVATLLAPLTTPFYMKFLAGHFVTIEYMKMTAEITNLVILPIIAGLMFRTIATPDPRLRSVFVHFIVFAAIIASVDLLFASFGVFSWKEYPKRFLSQSGIFLVLPMVGAALLRHLVVHKPAVFDRFLSFFSMIGLLLTIVIINAAGRDHLLQIGFLLILACLLHNLLGFLFGYWISRLVGLDERSCRTISIEVGLQNGGLASGIALQMGKIATVGLAPAVFGPLMNITGSSLATWWRGSPVQGSSDSLNPAPKSAFAATTDEYPP